MSSQSRRNHNITIHVPLTKYQNHKWDAAVGLPIPKLDPSGVGDVEHSIKDRQPVYHIILEK